MKIEQPTEAIEVVFTCSGQATGKMRNDLNVKMVEPMLEEFTFATDERPFHGGHATAPPLGVVHRWYDRMYHDPTPRFCKKNGRRNHRSSCRLQNCLAMDTKGSYL